MSNRSATIDKPKEGTAPAVLKPGTRVVWASDEPNDVAGLVGTVQPPGLMDDEYARYYGEPVATVCWPARGKRCGTARIMRVSRLAVTQ